MCPQTRLAYFSETTAPLLGELFTIILNSKLASQGGICGGDRRHILATYILDLLMKRCCLPDEEKSETLSSNKQGLNAFCFLSLTLTRVKLSVRLKLSMVDSIAISIFVLILTLTESETGFSN